MVSLDQWDAYWADELESMLSQRDQPVSCPACLYDLRGTLLVEGRCPECGQQYHLAFEEEFTPLHTGAVQRLAWLRVCPGSPPDRPDGEPAGAHEPARDELEKGVGAFLAGVLIRMALAILLVYLLVHWHWPA